MLCKRSLQTSQAVGGFGRLSNQAYLVSDSRQRHLDTASLRCRLLINVENPFIVPKVVSGFF